MKKLLVRILAIVLLVAVCFALRQYFEKKDDELERMAQAETDEDSAGASKSRRNYDTPVSGDHPALLWFSQEYGNREPFLGFSGDLTDDGMEDLIIIFHEDSKTDICWMTVAVMGSDGTWTDLEPVRAPVENQSLRVFEMDGEGPLEVVITGEKEGQIGYAIFRIIDGELINLFAEDMSDCC